MQLIRQRAASQLNNFQMLRGFLRCCPSRLSSVFISIRFLHNMRLIQFVEGGKQRVGVETKDGGDVVDVCSGDTSIPTDMRSFLEGGEEMINKAQGYSYDTNKAEVSYGSVGLSCEV